MRYDFLISSLLFGISTFLLFWAIYIFSRKELLIGIKLLGFFSLANSVYLMSYASFILSDSQEFMIFFNHLQFLGLALLPAFWFLISVQQKYQKRKLSKRRLATLFFVPCLAIVANFLYPTQVVQNLSWIQKLFYLSHEVVSNEAFGIGFTSVLFEKGIFYYILLGFNIVVLGSSFLSYLATYKKCEREFKKNALILMGSTFMCIVFFSVFLFNPKTYSIDLSPFASAIAVIIAFFTLFKYELYDLTPKALNKIYQNASSPVLILDRSMTVVSANDKTRELYSDWIDFSEKVTLESFEKKDKNFSFDLKNNGFHESVYKKKGEKIYFSVTLEKILSNHNKLTGYLISFQDITAHKKELSQLEKMATIDDLTKIFNRRIFYLKATEAFDDAVIHKQSISFVMFDLDNFKDVNDIYGHQAGDFVLAEMARLFSEQLDKNAVFARYGGEEFIIFLSEQSPNKTLELANQLRRLLEQHVFIYSHHKIHITASFGVSGTYKQITKSFEQYIKDADDALYEVKHNTKNQVAIKE